MALISVSTLLPAAGEYLRPEDFLAEDLLADARFDEYFFAEDFFAGARFADDRLADDFFALVPFRPLLFLVAAPLREELLFFALVDFFFAAFLVAIFFLLKIRCIPDSSQLYDGS